MRRNRVRELIESGGFAINAWLSSDSAYAAEVIGHAGFDSVTVDAQHGMLGRAEVARLLAAISSSPAVPLVRPSAADPLEVGWCLDAGAYGVIVPAVDTPEIAQAICAAAAYPPAGSRSFGPGRGLTYGGADYVQGAQDELMVWVMIESGTALKNLDAILATPGLYGVYIGPNDLALDLGLPAGGRISDDITQHADQIRARAHDHGVKTGIFTADGAEAAKFVQLGFDLVTPGNDMSMLRSASAERLATARAGRG